MTLPSSLVAMLAHPVEVAALIEKAEGWLLEAALTAVISKARSSETESVLRNAQVSRILSPA
jgi:hypothetical protein